MKRLERVASECLFPLCFKYLRPTGRAAVLVPPNVLFGNGRAEKSIRHHLVYGWTLQAIISLVSEPSRTMVIVAQCLGLPVSELLALNGKTWI
jgi:type I restriction-modification system DNA methylase subunit